MPISSPDPLLMGEPTPQSLSQPIRINASVGGQRFNNTHGMTTSSSLGGRPHPPSSSPQTPRKGHFSIEIPRLPHLSMPKLSDSQSHKGKKRETGQVDGGMETAVKRFKVQAGGAERGVQSSGQSSSKSTIRRADAVDHVERLTDLIDDIFQADDLTVGDTSTRALAWESAAGGDYTPMKSLFRHDSDLSDGRRSLRAETLKKLDKQLGKVKGKGKAAELLQEVDTAGLQRLVELLQRSWERAGDLEFWEDDKVKPRTDDGGSPSKFKAKANSPSKARLPKKSTPRKKPARRDSDQSEEEIDGLEEPSHGLERSPAQVAHSSPLAKQSYDVRMDDGDDSDDEVEVWSTAALERFEHSLRSITDAVLAVTAALSLLNLTKLERSFYSSDTILALLSTLRTATDQVLFPLLEAPVDSPLAALAGDHFEPLTALCTAVQGAVGGVVRLITAQQMSEEIVISVVYFALGPFFHDAPAVVGGRGKKAAPGGPVGAEMKNIRAEALGLVRAVYGKYTDQRSWILEEMLLSATKLGVGKKGKGAVRLRNGMAVHTVSALVMGLLQTCPADLRQTAQRTLREARPHTAGRGAEQDELAIDVDGDEDDSSHPIDRVSRNLLEPAFDSAQKSARVVVGYLMGRACKAGKTSAGSTEAEYRAVFETLISDCLAALRLPEWPAAELLLSVCAKTMVSYLAEPKSTHDANALKGLALDHVGQITARIRQDLGPDSKATTYKSLQEIVRLADSDALDSLYAAQVKVIEHLSRSDASGGPSDGAGEFVAVRFGRELGQAGASIASTLEAAEEGEVKMKRDAIAALERFEAHLGLLAAKLWDPIQDDVFGPSLDDEKDKIDALALDLSRVQSLASTYEPLLHRILSTCDATSVTFRTKALRAVGLIVHEDPDLFLEPDIRHTIESRMRDASPAVRDAALELVGKYVVNQPGLAAEYLPQICQRAADAGLGVRKRVVKLLKVLYGLLPQDRVKVEICRRLVWRIRDEDDGIRDLVVDTLEELWFATGKVGARATGLKDEREGTPGLGAGRLAGVLLGVIAGEKGVQGKPSPVPPPVDEVLRAVGCH